MQWVFDLKTSCNNFSRKVGKVTNDSCQEFLGIKMSVTGCTLMAKRGVSLTVGLMLTRQYE